MGIFRPLLFPSKAGPPPDLDTARSNWTEKMPRFFTYLEDTLAGRDHFVGERVTLADIAVAVQLLQLDIVAGPLPIVDWPALNRFLERMREPPVFSANLKACRAFVDKQLGGPVDLQPVTD